jgi:type I restriction enzyme S subunit
LTVYISFEKKNIMINRKEALVLTKKIQDNLKNIYGSNLKLVYLFGSYARNEANEDSDIDVAVVLDGIISRYKERERCSKMRAKISLENNCVINLFFLEKSELLAKEYALFRNIFEEGIIV